MKIIDAYSAIKELINDEKKRRTYKSRRVLLGKHTVLGDTCRIGEYTYIGDYTTARLNVSIGRYTSIGENCIIGPGEHRTGFISTCYWIYKETIGPEYYDGDQLKRSGGVVIGNDVWVGCDVIIQRGVRIGNGAIIGANSFVNKDVEDYTIVAGSPARFIKARFDKTIADDIRKSAWWEYDLDDARKIIHELEKKHGINIY